MTDYSSNDRPTTSLTAAPVDVTANEAPARGERGCLWGVIGALGCLLVLLTPFVVALALGAASVSSIMGGLESIFRPQFTTSATVMLERIQGVSQLTAVRYNYSSVVTIEREMPPLLAALYGERQVMIAVGYINAGIDLTLLDEDDLRRDGGSLVITLPPPNLHDCFLNEQASYIVSRDTGLFARPAPELDTEARRYAVRQFRDMALENGILDDVQVQADEVIRGLMTAIDADESIRVEITPPGTETPFPESCA